MGAVCENIATKNFPELEDVSATRFTYYQPCQWPQDQFFHSKIQQLKQKEDFKEFIEGKILKKNRDTNQYYIGEWDATGSPKGQGVMYRPGDLFYHGHFDVNPHGIGYLDYLKNQFTYQGQFNRGKIEGQGKYTKYNHLYSYEGTINSEFQPTTGKLIFNAQEQLKSFVARIEDYPNNKAKIEYRDGRTYQGYLNLSTFVPQGEGIAKYPNNSVYQGEWFNGQFHGKGKFTWSNGTEYFGDYKQGKKHGHGQFTYLSKKVYVGAWENGKQHGAGELLDQSGNIIKKGLWKDGQFDIPALY